MSFVENVNLIANTIKNSIVQGTDNFLKLIETPIITGASGGTGVSNTDKTITLGGNLTTSGAFDTTLISTDTTSVTIPISGTLSTLDGVETLSNKTLVAPIINGIQTAQAGDNTTQLATTAFVVGEKGGRRNYIINGNFDKWDYSISQTSVGYGSDNRWQNNNSGSTKTHSQVVCGDTERVLFNAMYFSRTAVSSVAGTGNFVAKLQTIENINLLAGKTVTLSFWAKADANKNIAIEFWQRFGTGGSPSTNIASIGSQLVSLTTTWQKKTITITFPSIVGKTLGTDGVQTTSSGFTFWFDAGSNFTQTAGLGQQSGTFYIAQVKIEDGSVATNGWHPYDGEFGGEIRACARYYQRNFVNGCVTQPYSTGGISFRFRTQVPMRIAATPNQISGTSLSSALEQISVGNNTPTSISILAAKTNSAFQVDFAGSFNASIPTTLSTDIIEIGAEL
jgi:hypothetical protein